MNTRRFCERENASRLDYLKRQNTCHLVPLIYGETRIKDVILITSIRSAARLEEEEPRPFLFRMSLDCGGAGLINDLGRESTQLLPGPEQVAVGVKVQLSQNLVAL